MGRMRNLFRKKTPLDEEMRMEAARLQQARETMLTAAEMADQKADEIDELAKDLAAGTTFSYEEACSTITMVISNGMTPARIRKLYHIEKPGGN